MIFKALSEFITSLFRGWLSERSRDKAHEDLGETKANLEYEQDAHDKIESADSVDIDTSPDGLLDDPNARDY